MCDKIKKLLICTLLFVVPVTICAQQRCYAPKSNKGVKLFQQGKYKEARALFVEAQYCSDMPKSGKENMVFWIKQCDEKLKSQNNTAKSTTPSQSSSSTKSSTTYPNKSTATESYLSAYPKSLYFPSEGGTKSVDVHCNGRWFVHVATASWVHLSQSGNKITLSADANNSSYERNDYFVLKSGDNTCRVNIKQGKSNLPPAYISASSTSVNFNTGGGKQTIYISSNRDWKVELPPAYWVQLTRNSNTIYLTAQKNTSGNRRTDSFILVAGDKRIRINISQEYVQSHGFFKEEEKFANNFFNIQGGYNLRSKDPYFGFSYSFVKSHLGFRLSGYTGIDDFSYIATIDPVFRLTNDNSALDLQLYFGGGIYDRKPIGEAGLRFAWRTKYDLSLWDFSMGCMGTLEGDVIPTLGVGVAIPFSPLIGVGSMLSNSTKKRYEYYDFSRSFLDITINTNMNWGISYSYVPSRTGWYLSTLFNPGMGFVTGPVLRIVNSRSPVDLQMYGGGGYFNDDYVIDFGMRIAPTPNNNYSWWNLSIGASLINEQPYFTVGASLSISAMVGGTALYLDLMNGLSSY